MWQNAEFLGRPCICCVKHSALLLCCCFADVYGAAPLPLARSAEVCVCVAALLRLYCCFTDVHGATPLHLARSAEVLISSPAEPTEYVNCLDSFFFMRASNSGTTISNVH